jgi:hypothetical protein
MFTGNENHDIKFADAGVLTKNYRLTIPAGDTLGGFFGKAALLQILNQPNCVGIRYYYGLNANNDKVLVIVGTDANENDLVDATNNYVCKEMSVLCPPHCGNNNVLNS